MIEEIRKRPFARPLLFCIAGIILQTCFELRFLSFGLLLFPLFCILGPFIATRKRQKLKPDYEARWVPGVVFTCLFLFVFIQLTAFHADLRRTNSSSPPSRLDEWARRSQQKLIEPIGQLRLPESTKSVLATITVGYRKEMPKETRRQFSTAGVAHILAVSGFHVAIVCNSISLALSFLRKSRAGRWLHYALTLLLLWAFTAISGFAPSSIRSALMLSFYLSGRQLSRTTDKYNTLFASAFCMLIYNPFYLFDIGFQLSYAAVASIQYFSPPLRALIKLKNPLIKEPWAWITISLAAQIGVTFLCLYYFGQFSTVFLFTNLPLTLIATLLIPTALLWMLLPAGFPLYGILQHIIESLCQSLTWIVETFSRVPGAALNFRFDLFTTLLCYFALFLFCYIRFKQSAKHSLKSQNRAAYDHVFDWKP